MKFLVSVILVAVTMAGQAVDKSMVSVKQAEKICNFFPPNKMKFPVRPTGQMSEMTFRRVIQVLNQVYSMEFRRLGRPPLYISPRWNDDDVNAFAFICDMPSMIGKRDYPEECGKMRTSLNVNTPFSLVAMFGGLARHPLMTAEGLILAACHEIGHHLGGFPRYGKNSEWASTEGQSDYFATAKCARKIFHAVGRNNEWLQRTGVPFDVRQTCNANFSQGSEDAAICMRSAMGGLSLARVLGSFGSDPINMINFSNIDRNVVKRTYEGHPAAQCRLDTYFAGSICKVSADKDFDLRDSRAGACAPQRFERAGSRPACWYKDPLI